MPADSIAVSLRNFGIGRPGDGDRLKVLTILRFTIGIDDEDPGDEQLVCRFLLASW